MRRRLARATGADDGDRLARIPPWIDSFQQKPGRLPMLRNLTPLPRFQLRRACPPITSLSIGRVAKVFLCVENGEDFIGGHTRALNRLENIRQSLHRTEKAADKSQREATSAPQRKSLP